MIPIKELTKKRKAEKEELKEILKHKRKNIYRLEDSKDFVQEYLKLHQILEKKGYIFANFYQSARTISFSYSSPIYGYIFIETILSKQSNILALFRFFDDFQDHTRAYTGTNEWKHDFCRILKIPMIGDLKYLDPDDGKYWLCDSLKKE